MDGRRPPIRQQRPQIGRSLLPSSYHGRYPHFSGNSAHHHGHTALSSHRPSERDMMRTRPGNSAELSAAMTPRKVPPAGSLGYPTQAPHIRVTVSPSLLREDWRTTINQTKRTHVIQSV
jgi:hypothetical protein